MSEPRHAHQSNDPDGETYWSEDDGSCIVCSNDAEARGDCRSCYGRGSHYSEPSCACDDDSCERDHIGIFACHPCKGTGRMDRKRVV